MRVLCGEGVFSCLCLAQHQAHVVITGTEEGCLLLWDLRESASEGRAAVSCITNPLFQEVTETTTSIVGALDARFVQSRLFFLGDSGSDARQRQGVQGRNWDGVGTYLQLARYAR